MSLKVSAIFPAIPGQFMGNRTEKSPLLSVFSAVRRVPESISSVGEAGSVAMFSRSSMAWRYVPLRRCAWRETGNRGQERCQEGDNMSPWKG